VDGEAGREDLEDRCARLLRRERLREHVVGEAGLDGDGAIEGRVARPHLEPEGEEHVDAIERGDAADVERRVHLQRARPWPRTFRRKPDEGAASSSCARSTRHGGAPCASDTSMMASSRSSLNVSPCGGCAFGLLRRAERGGELLERRARRPRVSHRAMASIAPWDLPTP
jgi:hypothetical protein